MLFSSIYVDLYLAIVAKYHRFFMCLRIYVRWYFWRSICIEGKKHRPGDIVWEQKLQVNDTLSTCHFRAPDPDSQFVSFIFGLSPHSVVLFQISLGFSKQGWTGCTISTFGWAGVQNGSCACAWLLHLALVPHEGNSQIIFELTTSRIWSQFCCTTSRISLGLSHHNFHKPIISDSSAKYR